VRECESEVAGVVVVVIPVGEQVYVVAVSFAACPLCSVKLLRLLSLINLRLCWMRCGPDPLLILLESSNRAVITVCMHATRTSLK
jgi:hypothetical protein